MITDGEIRDDVVDELRWDPRLTAPDTLGVAVTDGEVTLNGHVSSYAEKMAAARAAERVCGVQAVANDLQVQLAGAPRDDSDIALAIANVLEWNAQVPEGAVQARVQGGWVTLEGEVEHDYQLREVERTVRQMRGVVGVTDTMTVKPPVAREQVQDVIEDALRREAQIDARHIKVQLSGGVAKLYGMVRSMREATAAADAAAAAPGISVVENHLVVIP